MNAVKRLFKIDEVNVYITVPFNALLQNIPQGEDMVYTTSH